VSPRSAPLAHGSNDGIGPVAGLEHGIELVLDKCPRLGAAIDIAQMPPQLSNVEYQLTPQLAWHDRAAHPQEQLQHTWTGTNDHHCLEADEDAIHPFGAGSLETMRCRFAFPSRLE